MTFTLFNQEFFYSSSFLLSTIFPSTLKPPQGSKRSAKLLLHEEKLHSFIIPLSSLKSWKSYTKRFSNLNILFVPILYATPSAYISSNLEDIYPFYVKSYRYQSYRKANINHQTTTLEFTILKHFINNIQIDSKILFSKRNPQMINEDYLLDKNKTIYLEGYGCCNNILNFHYEFNNMLYYTLRRDYFFVSNTITFHAFINAANFMVNTIPLEDIELITSYNCFQYDVIEISMINNIAKEWDYYFKLCKYNKKFRYYKKIIKMQYKIKRNLFKTFIKNIKDINTTNHSSLRTKNTLILRNYVLFFPLLQKYTLLDSIIWFNVYHAHKRVYNPYNKYTFEYFHYLFTFIKDHYHTNCANPDDYLRNEYLRNFRKIKSYIPSYDKIHLILFIIDLKVYYLLVKHNYIDEIFSSLYSPLENETYLVQRIHLLELIKMFYHREEKKEFARYYPPINIDTFSSAHGYDINKRLHFF